MARKRRIYQIELEAPYLLGVMIGVPRSRNIPIREICVGLTKAAAEMAARRFTYVWLIIMASWEGAPGWKEMMQAWDTFIYRNDYKEVNQCWKKWVTKEGWTEGVVEPAREWWGHKHIAAFNQRAERAVKANPVILEQIALDMCQTPEGRAALMAMAKEEERSTNSKRGKTGGSLKRGRRHPIGPGIGETVERAQDHS